MSAFVNKGANAYRQTEVQSRTPLELVVMLYDGALRFVALARSALERKDIRARQQAISRALAIMSELQSTLDMEKGGEIAVSLDALYVYINGRILEGASKQNLAALDEAAHLLTTLRDGWSDIAQPGGASGAQGK
jgi:flagellar protein FliS